jgi:hypothetical protein
VIHLFRTIEPTDQVLKRIFTLGAATVPVPEEPTVECLTHNLRFGTALFRRKTLELAILLARYVCLLPN